LTATRTSKDGTAKQRIVSGCRGSWIQQGGLGGGFQRLRSSTRLGGAIIEARKTSDEIGEVIKRGLWSNRYGMRKNRQGPKKEEKNTADLVVEVHHPQRRD